MRLIENPKITVITAVKNDRDNLEETILSVIKNKTSNLSYVIVDGRSDDGTLNVIGQYASCIDYWISEPDNGLYEAYNKGWELADGNSYVLFLGAGDRLIQLPVEELKSSYGKIIYGRVERGRKKKFVSRVSTMSMFANTLHHQALLVPKNLHADPPFNTKYKVYADFDFNQRLIKMGAPFVYAKNFRTFALPGGVSDRYSKESFLIAYKNFGFYFGLLAFLFYFYQKSKIILKR